MDAVIHVVRCFEDPDVVHVDGSVDPMRDIETINYELIFADLETVDKRIDKATKMLKGDKKYQAEIDVLNKIKECLEAGKPARSAEITDDEKALISDMSLLTAKPVIYAANVSEDELASGAENNKYIKALNELAEKEGSEVLPVSAKIEEEISQLEPEEKTEFLNALNLTESGLDRLVKKSI